MKQCCNCKQEVSDKAVLCMHCGCFVNEQYEKKFNHMQPQGETKIGIGILMALFGGIAGLIMGLCIYAPKSIERKSFWISWLVTSIVLIFITLIFFVGVLGLDYLLAQLPPGIDMFIR